LSSRFDSWTLLNVRPSEFQLNGTVNYFQRKFVNEVRRCDELERKLRYIEAEVKKDGVPIPDNLMELPRAPNPRAIIDLEVKPSRVSDFDFESIDFRRFCPDHFSNLRR